MMDMYALLMGGSGGGGGGSDSVIVVHNVEGTLDKTWQELFDALAAAKIVIIPSSENEEPVTSAAGIDFIITAGHASGASYLIVTVSGVEYYADTPSDYPMMD